MINKIVKSAKETIGVQFFFLIKIYIYTLMTAYPLITLAHALGIKRVRRAAASSLHARRV